MRIDKQKQADILLSINELLKKKGFSGAAYLFGGNSLISQEIIERTTKDVDFFLLIVEAHADLIPFIKAEASKQFKIKVDIGLNGKFEIAVKGFTWTLPKSAYSRAVHLMKFSHLNIFALHPVDIVALKCDRLNKQDQKDIETVFRTLKPAKEQVTAIFEEYSALLEGNKSSIDNIRENFYQLVLTIHNLVMQRKN